MLRRSATVGLGVTAVLAGTLTAGFMTRGDDYQGVCVDETTQQRVRDEDCRDGGHGVGGHGARWYYVRSDRRMPGIGEKASTGTFTVPSDGSVHRGGVSAKGGHVSRGGFGGLHGHGGS
ncbi:MAG: hypothetical protein U0Q15_04140 [Kineosporiaceae bacterium]